MVKSETLRRWLSHKPICFKIEVSHVSGEFSKIWKSKTKVLVVFTFCRLPKLWLIVGAPCESLPVNRCIEKAGFKLSMKK